MDTPTPYIAPRTCRVIDENGEPKRGGQNSATPLADFAEAAAYVLIAEPGAGKTTAFETEAENPGAVYKTVQKFIRYDAKPAWHNTTLFLDGLDEARAGTEDGRKPLDKVARKLDRLERPRFRLSCRWADWLAVTDKEALSDVSPDGNLIVIRLDPLAKADIKAILAKNHGVEDPDGFIAAARERGVERLLNNPQNLKLLAKAVSEGQWPDSRKETFERACGLLVREENKEHSAADESSADEGPLLEAAGRLCAVQLLSGAAGYTLPDRAEPDGDYPSVAEVDGKSGSLERKALATRLFVGVAEGKLAPEHRGIAEFLAARHISGLLNNKVLPPARVLALITGFDGEMLPPFWNFVSWLAVHNKPSRRRLSRLNPSGLIYAGDALLYSVDEKQDLVRNLRREASRNPWCSRSLSKVPGIGGIVSPELEGTFREILTDSERAHEHQSYVMLLLQMLADGEPLPALSSLLENIVRDPTWREGVRYWALDALVSYCQRGRLDFSVLEAMVTEIEDGSINDPHDELQGILLKALYPNVLSIAQVQRLLRQPKSPDAREYVGFWMHHLPSASTPEQIAELLDSIAARYQDCRPRLIREVGRATQLGSLPMELLARVLKETTWNFSTKRLYHWLRVLSDPDLQVPGGKTSSIRTDLEWRQDALKDLIAHGVESCLQTGEQLTDLIDRCLLGARPLWHGPWCLEMALEAEDSRVASFYVRELAECVIDGRRADRLTVEAARAALAPTESLVQQFNEIVNARAQNRTGTESPTAVKSAASTRSLKDTAKQRARQEQFVVQADSLHRGLGTPQLLHRAAEAYLGPVADSATKTLHERLGELLGSRADLIDCLLAGLETTIARPDLPNCDDVVQSFDRRSINHLVLPFMAGLHSLEQSERLSINDLNENQIRLAVTTLYMLPRCAVDPDSADETVMYRPRWFQTLLRDKPTSVACVLRRSAALKLTSGIQPAAELRELANAEDHRRVAELVSLPLLGAFPKPETEVALMSLCWLLNAALTSCDRSDVGRVIKGRLEAVGQGTAERGCWLGAAYLVSPQEFREDLRALEEDEDGLKWLARFVAAGRFSTDSIARLTSGHLEPFLAAMNAARRLNRLPVRAYWATAHAIVGLSNDPSAVATEALEALAKSPEAEPWSPAITDARETQARKRRELEYSYPDVKQVVRTLKNEAPAKAGDLAALVFHELEDLAHKIHHGNTSDWRQYWNVVGHKCLQKPKPENECRGALLSDLRERLDRLGIDAQPEGTYADDKRSDIRVSFGGFNVPVEIKRSCHDDLWTAIHDQLIPKYTRDPGAAGCGIYLVFWFGNTEKCRPTKCSGWTPESAKDVKQRIQQSLSDQEESLIRVCVVDVSAPLRP